MAAPMQVGAEAGGWGQGCLAVERILSGGREGSSEVMSNCGTGTF